MRLQSSSYKASELIILFVLVPVSFTVGYPLWIKGIIALFGFAYVVYVLLKIENLKFGLNTDIKWKLFFRKLIARFFVIAVTTTLYVYFVERDNLFIVIINKPLLFAIILLVYSLLSVYPQELIYRTFFFSRYKEFFQNEKLLIFVNAVLFSLAHLFFKSALVLVLTFFGGILFALTFNKTESTFLVSVEHALYGSWLFTIGMGSMLGFPN